MSDMNLPPGYGSAAIDPPEPRKAEGPDDDVLFERFRDDCDEAGIDPHDPLARVKLNQRK